MSYVKIRHLSMSFSGNKVFNDICFDIYQGEFVTLLGPSGCGKSTLLRSIAGLHPIDHGTVEVNGKIISKLPPQNRHISMVFQSYALFPNLTVMGNIAFGLKIKKIPREEIDSAVSEIINLVALNGRENYYPHQLSGGQCQRVALARALVVRPRILLLDEPLSALDAKIRKRLRQQIKEIQRTLNLTTLFVTHDQEEAMILSDRIFLMNKGNIVQHGAPEEIYTQPASEFVAEFMGNFNIITADQASKWFAKSIDKKVAIRPESIYIAEAGRQYSPWVTRPFQGIIKNCQLLGNVVRYSVAIEQQELQVDLLNRSSEVLYATGSVVELLFNTREIQPLHE